MRVLGVDPGTVATGWGVIDDRGREIRYVDGGVIRARGALEQRLVKVFAEIERILATFAPTWMSLEKTFVGENVQSAFRLGEARGVILLAATRAGVAVREYSPAEIKVAVVGHGRADKMQMQTMVARLLAVPGLRASDEADALGAAICHLHTQGFVAQLAGNAPRQSRRAWTNHVTKGAVATDGFKAPRRLQVPSPTGRGVG